MIPGARIVPSVFKKPLLDLCPLGSRKKREVRLLPLKKNEVVGVSLTAECRREADPPLLVHLMLVLPDKTSQIPAYCGTKWDEVGYYGATYTLLDRDVKGLFLLIFGF